MSKLHLCVPRRSHCRRGPPLPRLLAPADEWKAGTARQKITPHELMWMAGYGSRNHPATGFLNDLWVKALVLEDMHGNCGVAIVTLDLVGIGRDVADPVLAELAARYRLARSNVALCCSHTHSGPVVGRNLHTLHYDLVDAEQQQKIDRYATELKQSVIDVVGRAVAALAPCEVSYGAGTADFAVNRRTNKEPDVPALRAAGQLKGPEDHEVPVLRVIDARGTPVAVLFGYACHATVLDGYDWSSDYPGFAQTELESRYPRCTALFVAGCGADQNPLPRRKVELAREYGRDLAQAVRNVLDTTMKPLSGPFAIRSAVVELPLANPDARRSSRRAIGGPVCRGPSPRILGAARRGENRFHRPTRIRFRPVPGTADVHHPGGRSGRRLHVANQE